LFAKVLINANLHEIMLTLMIFFLTMNFIMIN